MAHLTNSQRVVLLEQKSQETRQKLGVVRQKLGVGEARLPCSLGEAEVNLAFEDEACFKQEAWERQQRAEAVILCVHRQFECSFLFSAFEVIDFSPGRVGSTGANSGKDQ